MNLLVQNWVKNISSHTNKRGSWYLLWVRFEIQDEHFHPFNILEFLFILEFLPWGICPINSQNDVSCFYRQQIRASSTSHKDTVFADENKQYPKARKVNGRFVLPWSESQLPSGLDAAKWFLISTNNSGLPGGRLRNFFQYDTKVNIHFITKTLNPSIKYFFDVVSYLYKLNQCIAKYYRDNFQTIKLSLKEMIIQI